MAEYIIHNFLPAGFVPPRPCPYCMADLPPMADGVTYCYSCGQIVHEDEAPDKPPEPEFIAGLDLGQVQDPTAFVGVERIEKNGDGWYSARSLHRFDLGTPYPRIIDTVCRWMSTKPYDRASLVVDGTGVGRAVVDSFRERPELSGRIVPVVITAGRAVSFSPNGDGSWHVAKLQLASALQSVISGQRLKVAHSLPFAGALNDEMRQFKAKITLAGNETFEAWRERDFDDLILALATAIWWSESRQVAQAITFTGPAARSPGKWSGLFSGLNP